MRIAFVVTTLLSATAVLVVFACGTDKVDSSTTGIGGGDGGDDDSAAQSSGFPAPADAGADVKRTESGCILFTTGMKSGAKVENVPHPGTVDWSNVQGALKEDSAVASVVLNDDQESAELRVSDFGLAVPTTAATYGIEVELKRRAQPDTAFLQTSLVDVSIPGKPTQYKHDSDTFFWPRLIVGTHPYGQAVDTWGVDLYPADVNVPAFAARLQVKKGQSTDGGVGPVTGTVDSLRVAVWYTTGDDAHCQK